LQMKEHLPLRYFVVTFAWAWLIEIPLALAGFGYIQIGKELLKVIALPATIVATFGPAAGVFYSLHTLNGKGSIKKYLKNLCDLRLGWKAWLIPIIVLGASTYVAWVVPELWGEPRLKMLLPSLWAFPLYLLIMIFFGGGQEELGWRGYILDPMEERLGPWLGNLLLGVIWAVWHLPLWFIPIPGFTESYTNFAGFTIQTIGYSYFFAWVRQTSGKRTMACLVTHGMANAFILVFPTVLMIKGVPQTRFWLWVWLTFAIGITTMMIRTLKVNRSKYEPEYQKKEINFETPHNRRGSNKCLARE